MLKNLLLLVFLWSYQLFTCPTSVHKSAMPAIVQDSLVQPSIPVFNKFKDFEYLLHQENDTLYVVNFWATWCKPCVEELPHFENIRSHFPNEKIKVLLVSLDDARELERKVIPFVQKKQLQSSIVLLDDADYNSWIDKVSPSWSGSIPSTYFYKGKKVAFYEAEFTEPELIEKVRTMLE